MDVQILGWIWEYAVKYDIEELCFAIEKDVKGEKILKSVCENHILVLIRNVQLFIRKLEQDEEADDKQLAKDLIHFIKISLWRGCFKMEKDIFKLLICLYFQCIIYVIAISKREKKLLKTYTDTKASIEFQSLEKSASLDLLDIRWIEKIFNSNYDYMIKTICNQKHKSDDFLHLKLDKQKLIIKGLENLKTRVKDLLKPTALENFDTPEIRSHFLRQRNHYHEILKYTKGGINVSGLKSLLKNTVKTFRVKIERTSRKENVPSISVDDDFEKMSPSKAITDTLNNNLINISNDSGDEIDDNLATDVQIISTDIEEQKTNASEGDSNENDKSTELKIISTKESKIIETLSDADNCDNDLEIIPIEQNLNREEVQLTVSNKTPTNTAEVSLKRKTQGKGSGTDSESEVIDITPKRKKLRSKLSSKNNKRDALLDNHEGLTSKLTSDFLTKTSNYLSSCFYQLLRGEEIRRDEEVIRLIYNNTKEPSHFNDEITKEIISIDNDEDNPINTIDSEDHDSSSDSISGDTSKECTVINQAENDIIEVHNIPLIAVDKSDNDLNDKKTDRKNYQNGDKLVEESCENVDSEVVEIDNTISVVRSLLKYLENEKKKLPSKSKDKSSRKRGETSKANEIEVIENNEAILSSVPEKYKSILSSLFGKISDSCKEMDKSTSTTSNTDNQSLTNSSNIKDKNSTNSQVSNIDSSSSSVSNNSRFSKPDSSLASQSQSSKSSSSTGDFNKGFSITSSDESVSLLSNNKSRNHKALEDSNYNSPKKLEDSKYNSPKKLDSTKNKSTSSSKLKSIHDSPCKARQGLDCDCEMIYETSSESNSSSSSSDLKTNDYQTSSINFSDICNRNSKISDSSGKNKKGISLENEDISTDSKTQRKPNRWLNSRNKRSNVDTDDMASRIKNSPRKKRLKTIDLTNSNETFFSTRSGVSEKLEVSLLKKKKEVPAIDLSGSNDTAYFSVLNTTQNSEKSQEISVIRTRSRDITPTKKQPVKLRLNRLCKKPLLDLSENTPVLEISDNESEAFHTPPSSPH